MTLYQLAKSVTAEGSIYTLLVLLVFLLLANVFRRDNAKTSGVVNDAERIRSLDVALKEKDAELKIANQTIHAMVMEKAELHGQMAGLKTQLESTQQKLEEATAKIDKLTDLVRELVEELGPHADKLKHFLDALG